MSIDIEHDDLVRALLQPRPGNVQRLLRPDLPEPAHRMTIDPKLSLGEVRSIEKGIRRMIDRERTAIETRPRAVSLLEVHRARIGHRQRIDRPLQRLSRWI